MKWSVIFLLVILLYVGFIGGFLHVSMNTEISQSLSQVTEQVIDSVVHISNDTRGWQGSGVIINDHLIMTARHVAEGGENFTITFNWGKEIAADRAISSKKYDIGFIWVDESMPKLAKLGSIEDLKLGQEVFIIGSPYGKINFNTLTTGIVSGINKDWETIDVRTGKKYGWEIVFTSDSSAHPGNSGGPVFTMDGVVRGLLVGGYSPVLNCIVPVDLVLSDIEEIEQMFVEDEYYIEEAPEYDYSTEYY